MVEHQPSETFPLQFKRLWFVLQVYISHSSPLIWILNFLTLPPTLFSLTNTPTCWTLYLCMNGRNCARKPGAHSPKYTSWRNNFPKHRKTRRKKETHLVENDREPHGDGETRVVVRHVVPGGGEVRLHRVLQTRVGHRLQQRVESRRRHLSPSLPHSVVYQMK